MVRTLHEAGIEVILDVVYNHTAEGNHLGPTLCFKGIDNRAYYRLVGKTPEYYYDTTGTGNSLNVQHPHTLQLIMDSLRYWVTEMHVDGFRFDLAAALAREFHEVDRLSTFFDMIQQDPVINRVKLIAEPWDIGEGGYQVGNFPALWSEWNGKYRDRVRDFWRGEPSTVGELASRLTGSSDLYQNDTRRPVASINFVTAHDGFTLRDLVSYNLKHNEANGEFNADGESHNRSWNCGVEGDTDDPAVLKLRAQQQRNLLATLFLSQGVPMLSMGDPQRQQQRVLPGQRDLVGQLVRDRSSAARIRPAFDRVPARASDVSAAPVVPGPADPRRRGHRVVQAQRRRDVRPGLDLTPRACARRVPERESDPRPNGSGAADRRRLVPASLQRAPASRELAAAPRLWRGMEAGARHRRIGVSDRLAAGRRPRDDSRPNCGRPGG